MRSLEFYNVFSDGVVGAWGQPASYARALLPQLVYVSVRGVQRHNTFTIVIWDLVFEQEEYALQVVEGRGNGTVLLRLQEQLRTDNVT